MDVDGVSGFDWRDFEVGSGGGHTADAGAETRAMGAPGLAGRDSRPARHV